MKSVHLIGSPELTLLLGRSLEHEGYIISGKHSTLQQVVEGFESREVDPSSIVIIEGGAGLGHPVKAADVLYYMTLFRQQLKRTRLIVQLDPSLQEDVEFIRSMVNLGIHDLHFTIKFQSADLQAWIKEKKTTRDYYNILEPKKGLFGLGKKNPAPTIPDAGSIAPAATPAGTTPSPAIQGNAAAAPERQRPVVQTQPQTSAWPKRAVTPSGGVRPGLASSPPVAVRPPTPTRAVEEVRPAPVVAKEAEAGQPAFVPAAAGGSRLPLVLGFCGAGAEEDVGAAVFLLASSLASLGWKPLVCGDDRPEISSLEDLVFDGEEADSTSSMFEHEGVTFYRRDFAWDISELMTSGYTHILLWLDIHRERRGIGGMELWWNTQVPVMVGNGAMWKYELLKERLDTLSLAEQKRCRLLLENGHQEVLKRLKKDFPELRSTLIPLHQDPLSPDKEAVEWVMKLLGTEKRLFRKPVILWAVAGGIVFVALMLLFIGISIVPDTK
ncbi:hypothetical protein [Paenibacillus herberti]|uniref:Uncharacterized protein n=1 Tax=Paenibacillus herberti TaxID=1619309 RepID=A0A229P025_9BACL|nr:hypothetical protein [Paenibacillus herberti]OXM15540.1 hypothetical protein CGZ75_02035 [Paenibacillus herberti]